MVEKRGPTSMLLDRLSPWLIIGAVIVLLPLFTYLTFQTIQRQKEFTVQLLLGKGASLIRSFEAGARTGMMGERRGSFKLQRLLMETAQQPDILYLFVVDGTGRILAHSDPNQIGRVIEDIPALSNIIASKKEHWRTYETDDDQTVFEVFRRFSPSRSPWPGHMRGMMGRRQPPPEAQPRQAEPETDKAIFVGLDMSAAGQAQRAGIRQAVVMGIVLLLIGSAGIILLFVVQNYQLARTRLTRVQAFSDHLVSRMPVGLLALDAQRKVTSINAMARRILRLPGDAGDSPDVTRLFPEDIWQRLETGGFDGKGLEQEIEVPAVDGTTIPLEITATRFLEKNAGFQGFILLFKDQSELRELRATIAQSQRLATVGSLAAGVAHEIRNPLSSIKGFATYFKERYGDAQENKHIADLMIQEIDRLNRVVTQLLDFAKPVGLALKPVEINAFMADSLTLVEQGIQNAGITVETRWLDQTHTITMDSEKMRQVLLNLYLNAMDAMTQGGRLAVSLSLQAEPPGIEIRVADSGVGIAQENVGHVFDPYYTTKPSGTGIGLALAFNIVQAHGGLLQVESALGQGSVFTILLPDIPQGAQ